MTSTPDDREQQVEQLLGSSELAEAIDDDDFRHFLDHIPIGIVVADLKAGGERIVYANVEFERLSGVAQTAIAGADWSVLDKHPGEEEGGLSLGRAILAGEDRIGHFRMLGDDGQNFVVDAFTTLIQGNDGRARYRMACLIDVTETERLSRERHREELQEKDLLLREIQHRVKNNLQLITALIRLEARHHGGNSPAMFDSLAGRIESLQLLYQQLSADEAGEDIDLGMYLSQIASAVTRVHAHEGVRLETRLDLCPVTVNVAMPVGLIVNEVMTNAFKYAFEGRDGGTISLVCECRDEGAFQVVVSDDGVGMPEGSDWPRSGKLGALIVQSLKENARARLSVHSAPGEGTRVTIAFVHRENAQD